MSKVEQFEVVFDNEQAVYREGDNVAGKVKLEAREDIKVKAIRLELYGVAVVRWDDQLGSVPADPDERLKGDCNKETYFHKKITLLEKDGGFLDKDPVVTAGSYTFDFECKLPPELPSSFEGKWGQIRYLAKAYIERPWRSNFVSKKAFTVLSGLDLNFIPEAASKIELCKYKETGNMCCNTGNVTIDWAVERSGYVPGEDIIINGAIQNESSETVATSKIVLYMIVDYKAKKRRRREKHPVTSVEKGETSPGDVTVWLESLHIPPVPPTGLSRCQIMDVIYELQFTATFEGKVAPVTFNKEIYIGTVPICKKEMKSCIAGMYNQPYKESMEFLNATDPKKASNLSLTQIIAAAVSAEQHTSPTAPSMTTMERQEAATPPRQPLESRPPPYAPGSILEPRDPPEAPNALELAQAIAEGNVATSPTAPGWNTMAQDSGLYPTLAASWFGAVSIREPDDNESVTGDLTYAPVYTYYSGNN